jgi:multiple sugar transport system substrate-binding protein
MSQEFDKLLDKLDTKISRRQMLRLMGGASAGLVLFSFGGSSFAQIIGIPDSGADLPSGNVTLRWVDSGDQKAVFFRQFFEAYQEARPNITIQYDPLPWNEIAQVVPLGVRGGNAHDVFQIPLGITAAQAIQEGWVQPLDDNIPNFEDWKQNFPPGIFLPGLTDFGGKTYTFPVTSNRRYSTHLLYNVEYMERAGYDPENEPFTWDSFREAARTITEQGQGQYYGFILGGNQINRWADIVRNLARMAGASAGTDDIDYRTGEYIFDSEEYIGAIELLLALRDDGSVFPGVLSLNAPQARAFMPQGAAGMILQGPWNIPQWERENPDFNFGVASQPIPNDREPLPLTVPPGGDNYLWIFSGSPHGAIAGDIFHYLGSTEGQIAWANIVGAADPPLFLEAALAADLSPRSRKAIELFSQQVRGGPSPLVRNPEVVEVTLELRTPEPSFAQVIQGLYTGQIADPRQAMQEVKARYERELDRAIEVARQRGANVSREDWVFPNWDPRDDYTLEDYEQLNN